MPAKSAEVKPRVGAQDGPSVPVYAREFHKSEGRVTCEDKNRVSNKPHQGRYHGARVRRWDSARCCVVSEPQQATQTDLGHDMEHQEVDASDLGESPSLGEMAIRGGEQAEVPGFYFQQTGRLRPMRLDGGPARRGRWGILLSKCARQTAYAIPREEQPRLAEIAAVRVRNEEYAAFCAFAEKRNAQIGQSGRKV